MEIYINGSSSGTVTVATGGGSLELSEAPKFYPYQLQLAFDKAEQETADHFNGQTCSMAGKDGYHTCPICYFRQRVKAHLGIE